MTPTSLTLSLLRRHGFTAAVVERWVQKPDKPIRVDLWHFADVLAVHPVERRFLLVQCTSLGHVGDRLEKARARPELRTWLQAGGEFEVWGWRRVRGRWQVKRVGVQADALEPIILQQPKRRRRADRQPDLFQIEGSADRRGRPARSRSCP